MKKILTHILIALAALIYIACNNNQPSTEPVSESGATLYYGGNISTMEGNEPEYVEALVEQDGKIAYIGSLKEAEDKFSNPSKIDLKGQTLVPGFIDGHSHFFAFGSQAITANLLASPDGNCNSIDDIISELKSWHQKNGTDKTQGWIVGMGFDDAVLKEKRFPTKEDLDKVSTEVPVMIVHISGHFSSVNTKGLEVLKITAASKNPVGGVIRRAKGGMEPNGVLEELASIPYMLKIITPTTTELNDLYLEAGQKMAASYGYTTANEGRAMGNHESMADYAKRGKFYIDVNSWIDYTYPQYMRSEWYSKNYNNHYRIAGLKITLDGSPQGRTAWRTTPYLLPPDGQKKGYKGYPAIPTDEELQKIMDTAFANNWQVKAHCNGDAAADQFFRAIGNSASRYGNSDRRNILIHGQLIRMDQLDSLKKYGITASLFPMHTFYWGDWYKEIIGPDNAQQISPIKSALKKGILVTSHTDAPVAFPNLMMILWTTVNRVSRSGTVMGPEERLTPYEALQSITIWGATQFFEENTKGSLKPGKLADMVILDKNPLTVDPMTLKDILIQETIKEGKSIYKRQPNPGL
ncbi:amidohydrolase [Flavihumibacter sp. RY-1]|uniref:Amidohydrolase n=1 Tax=Flavihumibacter fluminis TaxID=2909236 RepID=A0ABS9BCU2_9BACT|nr:amidohydrolase [Flavihumibacter fluminis]MCF1713251.1 amidohydrolase [Flavihumibacter fluminis]